MHHEHEPGPLAVLAGAIALAGGLYLACILLLSI